MRGRAIADARPASSSRRQALLRPVWNRRRRWYLAWTCGPLWLALAVQSWGEWSLSTGVVAGMGVSLIVAGSLVRWIAGPCLR